MGRKEKRQQDKYVKSRLSNKQYLGLKQAINMQLINDEVEKRMEFNKLLFISALTEAVEKNKISKTKLSMVLDDMETIMARNASKIIEAKKELEDK